MSSPSFSPAGTSSTRVPTPVSRDRPRRRWSTTSSTPTWSWTRIAHRLRAGHAELALEQWSELVARLPQVQAPPALLLHLAQALLEQDRREDASIALRLAMLSAVGQEGGGLAMRIARMTREWDPHAATMALRVALARPDLEPQVRADAQALLSRLQADPV